MLKVLILLLIFGLPVYLIYKHGLTGAIKIASEKSVQLWEWSKKHFLKFIDQLNK